MPVANKLQESMIKVVTMASINNSLSYAIIANLMHTSSDINTAMLNLSGGLKTNASVADYSVGSLLKYQSNTLTTANINAGQGKSLATTAKSALEQIVILLQKQQSLATQAQDDSLTDNERANLNLAFQDVTTEINRIATTTKFNNKVLLDGSASGLTNLTTATAQAAENYTLLTTADFTMSGTTAAGNLTTSSVFTPVATENVGDVAGTATLTFTVSGVALAADAQVTINATAINFGTGTTTAAGLAAAFVAAAEASTNADVRNFIYKDNGDGTVTVTTADLGTAANGTTFDVTDTSGGKVTAATFGDDSIIGVAKSLTSATTKTLGANRTVAAGDRTMDANLQGHLTDFTATLDTTGTQNTATFTTIINGQTYTSQAVTLFGTGGYNSKGNTIKTAQAITFYNASGPTDTSGEYTNNAFTLTVGASDITVSGATQGAVENSLTTIAQDFETQLAANRINQNRGIILPGSINDAGNIFTISTAATGTTFAGIRGFDAVGTNAKGDVNFVGDTFGTNGYNGTIGEFSYNTSTHKITTTINGEVYTSDLSTSAANIGALTTEGLANGAGSFNTTTDILSVGAGTTIVFHSASTTDNKQLRLTLTNLTDTSIDLSTSSLATTFTSDLNTLFGVTDNPSLSFQVGTDATNTIGLSLKNAQTTALYIDDAGAGKTLDISTVAGAQQASEVLGNAVNNTLSRIATTYSAITSFTSAITTNNVMINNFDAASSTLLNTDYVTESTILANSMLKYNAAVAALVQQQSKLAGLLKLLS